MSLDARKNNHGQLARNTIALYLRTALMLVINLYTSRVILRVLGVDDFAIYSIIGNFVAMFTIATSTLTVATQRFITVEIGRGSEEDIRKTFSTALSLHLVIAGLLIIICEIAGMWYINNKMILPETRVEAAQMVFHCSLIAFIFQFISIPYTSLIIAYEHMGAWAWISIAEVLLKLIGVLILPTLPNGFDYLVWYSVFIVIGAIVVRITYGIYCHLKFPHCSYQWYLDRKQTREMSSFMGWNIFGIGADIVSKQFITLLLNAFFVLAVNAARGIAIQVENAVANFTRQISMAFNPQITKSFSNNDYNRLIYLVRLGAKLGFFLYLIVAIPLIAETPAILSAWLGEYPNYTVTFVRLSLINNLIISLSYTLDTMIFASGRIRGMQIWTALLLIACFPISYISFQHGLPPYYCYLATITMTSILLIVKIRIASNLLSECPLGFARMILTHCLPAAILAVAIPAAFHFSGIGQTSALTTALLHCIVFVVWSIVIITIVGLDGNERQTAKQYITNFLCR